MFEIYAVIASILLPTGLLGLAYLLSYIQTNNKNQPLLWNLTNECIVTIFLGIFYMYCAIILSKKTGANEAQFVNNHIDDLAIINDTAAYNHIGMPPTFYNKNEPIPLDQTNEVADARNSKNGAEFQEIHLVRNSSVGKKAKNGREGGRTFKHLHSQIRKPEGATTDTSEYKECFLKAFFYRALLAYSFVSCAISLLNTCHLCKQCLKNEEYKGTLQQEPNTENPSATFGDKIVDVSDDNSSQNDNAAPVGPLFDEDSLGSAEPVATPNLDIFNVKKTTQLHAIDGQCSESVLNVKEESKIFTAGKSLITLTFPPVIVCILYFAMKSGHETNGALSNNPSLDILHNFNVMSSDIPVTDLDKTFPANENINDTDRSEVKSVLSRVYAVIDKFQEEYEAPKYVPTVKGQYFYYLTKANDNSTERCLLFLLDDKTNLKTFDFLLFVISFFLVIFYTKLSEVKLPKSTSSRNLGKCTVVFLILWTPVLSETIVSTFITNKVPNIFSNLLLLVGNIDRLFFTIQNIDIYKRYGKGGGGIIKPAFK